MITVPRALGLISLITMLVALNACSSAPAMQQGPNAEVTFDGLVRVDNVGWDRLWARPDFDISNYDKIMFGGTEIQYRPTPRTSRLSSRVSSRGEFSLSEENRARLEAIVIEEFGEELANINNFDIATEPGTDTLLLMIYLSDVVSNFPPETFQRRDIYLTEVGSARLTLELKDSESNTVLVRIVDRRAAESMGGQLQFTNSVTAWTEVRQLASRWGRLMRERIDQMAVDF